MAHKNIALFVAHRGCPHQCVFCNQHKISGSVGNISPDDVTEAVHIALKGKKEGDTLEIAFFGGSFTAIERRYMTSLLSAAYPFVKSGAVDGIRISTRPDYIDDEILFYIKSFGVTSIELGAQSMDEEVLKLSNRGHTALDVVNASQLIKKHGFSLGLQMMTGLPGDTREKSISTAKELLKLKPDTMRVYPSIVIEGTKMAQMYRDKEYIPQNLEEAVELCAYLLELFEEQNNIPVIKLGLQHENSLEEGYVAGPFHPAFRELCESEIYLKKMHKLLICDYKNRSVTFYVPQRELSKAVGQKRRNIELLKGDGYTVKIKPDLSAKNGIRLEVGEII